MVTGKYYRKKYIYHNWGPFVATWSVQLRACTWAKTQQTLCGGCIMQSATLVVIKKDDLKQDAIWLSHARCYFQCVQVQQLEQGSVIRRQRVCMPRKFVTVTKIVLTTAMKLIAVRARLYTVSRVLIILVCLIQHVFTLKQIQYGMIKIQNT